MTAIPSGYSCCGGTGLNVSEIWGVREESMTHELKGFVFEWIERNRQSVIEACDALWRTPEVAMQEVKTSLILRNWLSKEGFQVETGTSGMPTAFVEEFARGSGKPVIAFLTDMDAVPGVSNKVVPWREPIVEGGAGHGCGHPEINAGNISAAIAIRHGMEKLKVDGTVRVYGAPAEELLVPCLINSVRDFGNLSFFNGQGI